ncbi:UNVERIFIED_CONTAM: hypothetical protein GTU68_065277 [Idotea baltica]|nr:hypothetical protein [Idotea baltica]
MAREIISTSKAPAALGPYSQAVKVDNTVYISGQIPLVPETMEVVEGDFETHARLVFSHLKSIAEEAGGNMNDFTKVNVFLTDLANFPLVNNVMAEFFDEPYPARAAIQVAALPKGVVVEADAVMVI